MAENEYLDTFSIRAWMPVLHAIRNDKSLEDVRDIMERCLYKELRLLHRSGARLLRDGIERFSASLETRLGSEFVDGESPRARSFLDLQQPEQASLGKPILDGLVGLLQCRCHDLLQELIKRDDRVELQHAQHILSEARLTLQSRLVHLAGRLTDPSWTPRRPRRSRGSQRSADDKTREALAESIVRRPSR